MSAFELKEEWTLGFNHIDTQHSKLLRLLSHVKKGNAPISYLLEEFIEYAGVHFFDEEKLMLDTNYDEAAFKWHKEEHRKFKEALLEISFTLLKVKNDTVSREKIVEGFKRFCMVWFEYHFLETDSKLVKFIKEVNK
jgi:hemerythrin-like metal-binding protein